MADAEQAAPVAVEGQEVAPEATNEQEVQTEGQPEVKPEVKEELKQEVRDQIKKLKIKVDGKELEKELNFANEEELIKMLQMAEMSGKRAQEAAELRKKSQARESELNNFLELLKEKPELILKEMGRDPVKFAEELLAAEVEKMQMDPKERRIKELEAEMKKIAEKESAAKKAHEEAQAKMVRDKYAADFENQLMGAMKSGSLPNNPELISRMTNYMSQAIQQGIDVSFEDLIPLVKSSHRELVKSTLKDFSAQELLELMSEAQINDVILKKTPPKKPKAPPTAQSVAKDTAAGKQDDTKLKLRDKSAGNFFHELTMKYAGQGD